MAKEKIDPNREISIKAYLRTTELEKPIQVMMEQLFKGRNHTLDDWKKIDENTNNRRCK